ncbi:MAG: outer membrane protein assembly factor BamA [Pseudomonadota bacterium]
MEKVRAAWRVHALKAITAICIVFSTLIVQQIVAAPGLALAQAPAREQSVIVRGNRRIETETVLSYMSLREGQTVTAEDLNRAVRRLFDTGLFRDVQIIPGEDQLIVEVIENPSINKIAFEGNDALEDEDLEQIINLRSRLPFTVSSAEADAQAIIEVYRRTGRYGAEVEPVIIERSDNRVDLVFEITEGELTDVTRIDFVGNTVYSDGRLRGVIETAESGIFSAFFSSDVYDPDRLELDKELLRQFYFERGFADFTVLSATAELSPDRSGFFITFSVSEGEEYTFGQISSEITAKGVDVEALEAAVPTDLEGEIYDASEVEEIANELTDLASQQGFAFVQVRPVPRKNASDRIIDITFSVIEGPKVFIERIEILGNNRTLDRVIRRNIDIVEGDAFDARKIRESRARIRALNFFSRVEIDREDGSAADRSVLKVRVKEKSTGSLSFGAGFSTSSGPIGSVTLSERNFLGRGQLVKAQINAAGETQIYDFEFQEPAFLDRDLAIGLRAFFIDDQSDEARVSVATLGLTPFVSFPLSADTRLELRYQGKRDDIQVSQFASPALRVDNGERFSSIFGYTVTHDKRNDALEPTDGYFLTWAQEFAGFGGDARYIRTSATAKAWTSLLDDEIVASLEADAGAVFGVLNDSPHYPERFALGGASLRGFATEGVGPRDRRTTDALGGNYRFATRLEVSFPLGLPEEFGTFGGFFVDAGTLFGLDSSRKNLTTPAIDDGLEFRVGAGALLFVSTPFGPLEMSFGVPLLKEDGDESEFFRLQVGTRF